MVIERFAPSPTGRLHLGHAYSAYIGWQAAKASGGRFLLRLEDLDTARVRPEYDAGILEDLRWLGLDWCDPVLRQSSRLDAYARVLADLAQRGLTFRCTCTRRDVQTAASAPQEGPMPTGPDGVVYPGTCHNAEHAPGQPHAVRLSLRNAIAALGGETAVDQLCFRELGDPRHPAAVETRLSSASLLEGTGDIVLARRDGTIAYHLAVVIDDAHQGITHVTRGEDLVEATPIQRLLQALIGVPTPIYRHHALVRDETGKRLAKRDDARAIEAYRRDGLSPEEVLELARNSIPPV